MDVQKCKLCNELANFWAHFSFLTSIIKYRRVSYVYISFKQLMEAEGKAALLLERPFMELVKHHFLLNLVVL